MAAHRSLNKLERKAHMSIHNHLDVAEESALVSSYTRDRFGKKHDVAVLLGGLNKKNES